LLSLGADHTAKDYDDRQAVHLAAMKGGEGGVACLSLLVDAGAACAESARQQWRPMHFAAARGNVDCVQFLLDAEDAKARGSLSPSLSLYALSLSVCVRKREREREQERERE